MDTDKAVSEKAPIELENLAVMLKKLSAMVRSLSPEERETLEVLLDDELMEVLGSSEDKEDLVSHREVFGHDLAGL